MRKIDWVQKLSSRKFWSLLAGFVGSILITFNVPQGSIAQITSIISGFGAIVIYILSEAAIDRASAKNNQDKKANESK